MQVARLDGRAHAPATSSAPELGEVGMHAVAAGTAVTKPDKTGGPTTELGEVGMHAMAGTAVTKPDKSGGPTTAAGTVAVDGGGCMRRAKAARTRGRTDGDEADRDGRFCEADLDVIADLVRRVGQQASGTLSSAAARLGSDGQLVHPTTA
jgi:hypothetical protein